MFRKNGSPLSLTSESKFKDQGLTCNDIDKKGYAIYLVSNYFI